MFRPGRAAGGSAISNDVLKTQYGAGWFGAYSLMIAWRGHDGGRLAILSHGGAVDQAGYQTCSRVELPRLLPGACNKHRPHS